MHDEREPGTLAGRAEVAGQVPRHLRQVGRLVHSLDATGLDPREVEERVHELLQPEAVALGYGEESPRVRGHPVLNLGEDVPDRPQHERQRGAELVADVAEERGLGAVQLGQGLGAASLLLVCARAGDGRRDARGGEVEEVAVVATQLEVPAHSDDQRARDLRAGRDRQHQQALGRGLRRWPDEDLDVGLGGPALGGTGQSADVGDRDVHGEDEIVALDPGGADELRADPRAVDQVEQRQGHVGRIQRENGRGLPADLLRALRIRRPRAELPQDAEAPLTEHASSLLADDAEDPADAPVLDADRVVRDVEVRLLEEPLTPEEKGVILRPECLSRANHALEQRTEDVPHLAPALAGGTTERPRMLRAEHGCIGVVVDRDELRTPEKDDLRPGRQQDADGAPQALRPGLHGAEGGRRPVVLADEVAHPAAPREKVVRRTNRVRPRRTTLGRHGRQTSTRCPSRAAKHQMAAPRSAMSSFARASIPVTTSSACMGS